MPAFNVNTGLRGMLWNIANLVGTFVKRTGECQLLLQCIPSVREGAV
jgi:hypothetical protein